MKTIMQTVGLFSFLIGSSGLVGTIETEVGNIWLALGLMIFGMITLVMTTRGIDEEDFDFDNGGFSNHTYSGKSRR